MIIKAEQKYIRMSPRKVRLVANSIKGLNPKDAIVHLSFLKKAAAVPVAKTIKQAIANATNSNLKEEDLRFKTIQVGEGATLKRWRAVSRGRAHKILKRSSHIKVILEAKEPEVTSEKPTTTKTEIQSPAKPKRRKRWGRK